MGGGLKGTGNAGGGGQPAQGGGGMQAGLPDWIKARYQQRGQQAPAPSGNMAGAGYTPGQAPQRPFVGRGTSVYRPPESSGGGWRELLASMGSGGGGRRPRPQSRLAGLMADQEEEEAPQAGVGRGAKGWSPDGASGLFDAITNNKTWHARGSLGDKGSKGDGNAVRRFMSMVGG